MTSKWRALIDHEQIRRWAKERGAKPSTVLGTQEADSIRIIGLDFPGPSGRALLEEISWNAWFQAFDENDLALIVLDEMANGHSSNFYEFVARESLEDYSHEPSTRDAKKKSSSRTLTPAPSIKTGGQRPRKAVDSSKGTTAEKRHNREQRSTSRHKPRRKAA